MWELGTVSDYRFKLCTIELGYESLDDNEEFYQYRIWGHFFPDPVTERRTSGQDITKYKIQGFREFLLSAYTQNFPDFASYSAAGYYKKNENTFLPNGETRPETYDYWGLGEAVRDLMMKANIDPVLLFKRQKKNIRGGTDAFETDFGDYLIRSEIVLDGNQNYGRPQSTQSYNPDDKYNWLFGYGTKVIEALTELARNFTYQFGVNALGHPYFRPVDVPSVVYDSAADDIEEIIANGEFSLNTYHWNVQPTGNISRVDSNSDPGIASGGVDDYVLKFSQTQNWVDIGIRQKLFTTVSIIEGEDYTFTFKYFVPTGDPDLKIAIQTVYQEYSLDGYITSGNLTTKNAWTEVTVSFTGFYSGLMVLLFLLDSASVGDVFYIDSVSIVRSIVLQSGGTNVKDLACYKGDYLTMMPLGSVTIEDVVCEGFFILFKALRGGNDTTKIQIQIRPDQSTNWESITSLEWNGSTVIGSGTGDDEYQLGLSSSYPATWAYYDGVSEISGVNPSIMKLDLTNYQKFSVKITVLAGVFNFDAFLTYKQNIDMPTSELDTTRSIGNLLIEENLKDVRNDIVVVGSSQGDDQVSNADGEVINPNNPIYAHVYSRAVDLDSIYDPTSSNYIGRRLPFEIYNPKITSQLRANHIAISTLQKYRQILAKGGFSIPGDPRLEPHDLVTFGDVKLGKLLAGTKLWIQRITETFTKTSSPERVKYVTQIDEVSPRRPLPSYFEKSEPDFSLYDNEPLINIQVKSRGMRIMGSDSTVLSNTVTIAADPGWLDNTWNGYKFIDDDGTVWDIEDTIASTKQLVLETGATPSAGNWAISFDPFDTDIYGAPLELHYDQVINGKIQVWVVDANNVALMQVNQYNWDQVQEWGKSKVVYWSGVVEMNTLEDREGYYVHPNVVNYLEPLRFHINFIPSNPSHQGNITIDTNNGGSIVIGSTVAVNSPLGPVSIYPRVLRDVPIVKIHNYGNHDYSDNIQYRSVCQDHGAVDADSFSIEMSSYDEFDSDDWSGYLMLITRIDRAQWDQSKAMALAIDSMQSATEIVVDVDPHNPAIRPEDYSYCEIIGTAENAVAGTPFQNLVQDHFRSSDNGNLGLKLKLSNLNSYIDSENGSFYIDGVQTHPQGVFTNYIAGEVFPKIQSHEGSQWETMMFHKNTSYLIRNQYIHPYKVQHLPEKGIFIPGVYHDGDFFNYNVQNIPQSPILTECKYWIRADMDILEVEESGEVHNVQMIASINNTIDTEGFVSHDEWEWTFNPSNKLFTLLNGIEKRLDVSDRKGYYFLFHFLIIDQAGRVVANNRRGYLTEMEYSFAYIVGWQPENNMGLIPKTRRINSISGLGETNLVKYANLFDVLTVWT